MPNSLTTVQLLSAQAMITSGDVLGFYNYMASQGYGYANLAKGVVECTLLSGGSTAQNFMVQEAERRGITLSDQKVFDVERVMANGYIKTLIDKSSLQGGNGAVNLDISYQDALAFHTGGFQSLGLPKELWTLYRPSEVLTQTQLESNWRKTVDPAQSGGLNPAWNFSTGFGLEMGLAAQLALLTGNLTTFAKAAEWSTGVSLAQAASVGRAAGITQASAGCSAVIADGVQQLQSKAATELAHNPLISPTGLGTAVRNSTSFITDISANDHLAVINAGGTVSDLWLLQKNAGNNFTLEEFGKAVLASNPSITNLNSVSVGQTIYIPQKLADGSITYHYVGGASVNSNVTTGEYHMVVPYTDGGGGQTVYSRTVDGDAGYTVRQMTSDSAGAVSYDFEGHQSTLDSEITRLKEVTVDGNSRTTRLFDVNGLLGSTTTQIDLTSGNISGLATETDDNFVLSLENADGSVSVEYSSDRKGDWDFDWTQNGVVYDGTMTLTSFLNGVLSTSADSTADATAAAEQSELLAEIDADEPGTVDLEATKIALNWLADRIGLQGVSDRWVGAFLGGSINAAWQVAASQTAAIQQALAFLSQRGWADRAPSVFEVRVLGFGNEPMPQAPSSSPQHPLVLDLSGDGIELVDPLRSNARFDLFADGSAASVGWVGKTNDILTLDINGNGTIDNAAEWFGEKFSVSGTPPAGQDGFAALATLADAGAAVFSRETSLVDSLSGKKYFDRVQVWLDANQDGVTDANELYTLQELGIDSIDLVNTPDGRIVAGGVISATAGYTTSDGTRGVVADVGLLETRYDNAPRTWLPSTGAIAFADYASKGYAAMAHGGALAVAAALAARPVDVSGDVAALTTWMGTQRYLTSNGYSGNPFFGLTTTEQTKIITYLGSDGSTKRGNDAGIHTVALLQEGAASITATANAASLTANGAELLVRAQTSAQIANAVGTEASREAASLDALTAAAAWGQAAAAFVNVHTKARTYDARMETVRVELNSLVPSGSSYNAHLPGGYTFFSPSDARFASATFAAYGTALELFSNLSLSVDSLLGSFAQSAGYSRAYVGAAGQTVNAANEFNLLLAGAGTQTFVLGSSLDHVLISAATGRAVVNGFQAGVQGDQLQLLGIGARVRLLHTASGIELITDDGLPRVVLNGVSVDSLDLFANLVGVSSISFQDWDQAGTRSLAGERIYDGLVHITEITASSHGDILIGDSLATKLIGGTGSDTFVVAGRGYDIRGASGTDTVSYERADHGVRADLWSGTDSLGSRLAQVENVRGSAWRDELTGDTLDNLIEGSGGHDNIVGGGGNDVYVFGRGDGVDRIINGVTNNTTASSMLRFKPGIGAADLWFERSGDDFVVRLLGTEDAVHMRDWYAADYRKIGAIELSDGTRLGTAGIEAIAVASAIWKQANLNFDPRRANQLPAEPSLLPLFAPGHTVPIVPTAVNVALQVSQAYDSGRATALAVSAQAMADTILNSAGSAGSTNLTSQNAAAQISPYGANPSGWRTYRHTNFNDPAVYIARTQRDFSSTHPLLGRGQFVETWAEIGSLAADVIYFSRRIDYQNSPSITQLIERAQGLPSGASATLNTLVSRLSSAGNDASAIAAVAVARQDALGAAKNANQQRTTESVSLARLEAAEAESTFVNSLLSYQRIRSTLQTSAPLLSANASSISAIVPTNVSFEYSSYTYSFYSANDQQKYNALWSAQNSAQAAYDVLSSRLNPLMDTFAAFGDFARVQLTSSGSNLTAGANGELLIAANGGSHVLSGGSGRDVFAFTSADVAAAHAVQSFQVGTMGDRLLVVAAGARTGYFAKHASGAAVLSYYVDSTNRASIRIADVAYGQLSLYDNLIGLQHADFSGMTHSVSVTLDSVTPRDFDGYTHVRDLTGSAFADFLIGDAQENQLAGGTGNDTLTGGWGNDTLSGGAGADALRGGAGSDTYLFALGDGNDVIEEQADSAGEIDVIAFGANIVASAVAVKRSGLDLVLSYSAQDSVTVRNWFASSSPRIEQVRFVNGNIWDAQEILAHLNAAPVANGQISTKQLVEDTLWSFTVPATLFSDPDGDVLTYSARLGTGAALPAWLSFDAQTRTFSGTPPNAAVGTLELVVEATDRLSAKAALNFALQIANVNDAPVVGTTLGAQTAQSGTAWSFSVPAGAFVDIDAGDILSYSARLTNGNPLPTWLSFDSQTRRFSGTPTNANLENLSLQVTAVDTSGASVSQQFGLALQAPVLAFVFTGTTGNDTLVGSGSNEIFVGGLGNDTLAGLGGDDVYRYRAGDGNDFIVDSVGFDTLEFLDLNPTDIAIGRGPNTADRDFVFDRKTGQTINVNLGLRPGYADVEQIKFANGTVWNIAQIQSAAANGAVVTQVGAAGNDLLSGYGGRDLLNGAAGDDTLQGLWGDDTLIGASGNDTYRYRKGDGVDTITLDVGGSDTLELIGILPTDVVVRKVQTNIEIVVLSVPGAVRLLNFMGTSALIKMEQFKFADGTIWTQAQIEAKALANQVADWAVPLAAIQMPMGVVAGNGSETMKADEESFADMNESFAALDTTDTGYEAFLTTQDEWIANKSTTGYFELAQDDSNGITMDAQAQNLAQAMASFAPQAAGQTMLSPGYIQLPATVIAPNWQ